MTTVVISAESRNGKRFRAVAGEKESFGETMGEALDALAERLYEPEGQAVVLVKDFRPDEFFTAQQQERMSQLMQTLREAQDGTGTISPEEQAELEALIEAELEGSIRRAEAINKLAK